MSSIKRYGKWYVLGAVAIAAFFIWQAVFWVEARRDRVFLHVLDVGQGDALLIESGRTRVLVDGGPDSSVLVKLGSLLPFWDRSIDLIILTHPHADHLDGILEVLKRYDVGTVLETGVNHSIPDYAEWRQVLAEKRIRAVIAEAGQKITLSGGAYLDILAPSKNFANASPKNIHEAMIVPELAYASTAALLMGDAEKPLERALAASGRDLRADILKVGHHGSKTSSSEEFLGRVLPKFAVISAGRKNRYGHPHQETLDRLARFAGRILRTDQLGNITFVSDGRNFVLAP